MHVPLRLTYPEKSHQAEDLRPLYEEFIQDDLQRFAQWKEMERKEILGPDDLKNIQSDVYDFLKQRVEWDSHAALASAFMDFRRLIQKDLFFH